MSTISNRSAGSQKTQRGYAQGNVILDPITGLPVDVIEDSAGKKRLAVDANFTAQNVDAQVELDFTEDSVSIGDADTGNTLAIEADGSINANINVDAASGDNIAISDGTDTLAVNPDGSINVNLTQSNPGTLSTIYDEITSVATSVLSTIQTFTAQVGVTTYLQKVEVSGSNIAEYTVEINSVVEDKKRTYFSGPLNAEFRFVETGTGLPLQVGDVVRVRVIHSRPDTGDFNSRIQIIEV